MFRNRGEMPQIGNNDNEGYSVPHYTNYWKRRYIVIHYDKTFVAIELIAVAIVLITAVLAYVYQYQATFNDPIAETKSTFLTMQLICIGITIVSTVLITILTKNKENLTRSLKLVVILSSIIIITHLGIKIYLDNKYNEEAFGEFYETYEQGANNTNNKKISLGLTGVKVLEAKEAYMDESISAYNKFTVKAIIYMVVYIVIVGIICYLLYRLSSKQNKRQQLSKDDAILFDEEENIKF